MLTRLYRHLLKETEKEECRRKKPNVAKAEVTLPPLSVSRHLVKTPHQTRILRRFWGDGLRWCCEGGAGRVGGCRFRSEGKELVGDGENQLTTANTSSCHGLQLHIRSGLWGCRHMLRFSAPAPDPTLPSVLSLFFF